MNTNQSEYKKIYATLAELISWGEDQDGNDWADLLRSLLIRSWYAMGSRDRQPFLGPGVLERRRPHEANVHYASMGVRDAKYKSRRPRSKEKRPNEIAT